MSATRSNLQSEQFRTVDRCADFGKERMDERMFYGETEVALLKTRAARHYERLHRAENEAADVLSAALGQTGRHHIRAYAAARIPKVHRLIFA
jgi:plasmid stability protein